MTEQCAAGSPTMLRCTRLSGCRKRIKELEAEIQKLRDTLNQLQERKKDKSKNLWRNIFKAYVTQIRVPFSMRRKASAAIFNLLEEEGMACCTLEIGPNGKPFKGSLPDDYDKLRCGKIGLKTEMNMWMTGSDFSTGGPSSWCCREHGVGLPEKEAHEAYLGIQMNVLKEVKD